MRHERDALEPPEAVLSRIGREMVSLLASLQLKEECLYEQLRIEQREQMKQRYSKRTPSLSFEVSSV